MKIISGNREFIPSAADILSMATSQTSDVHDIFRQALNRFRQTIASLEREKDFWRSQAIEYENKLMKLQNQSYPQQ